MSVTKSVGDEVWVTLRKEWTQDPYTEQWFRWCADRFGSWFRLYKMSGDHWELWLNNTEKQVWEAIDFPCKSSSSSNNTKWWEGWINPVNWNCSQCKHCPLFPQCAQWPCSECNTCVGWPDCPPVVVAEDGVAKVDTTAAAATVARDDDGDETPSMYLKNVHVPGIPAEFLSSGLMSYVSRGSTMNRMKKSSVVIEEIKSSSNQQKQDLSDLNRSKAQTAQPASQQVLASHSSHVQPPAAPPRMQAQPVKGPENKLPAPNRRAGVAAPPPSSSSWKAGASSSSSSASSDSPSEPRRRKTKKLKQSQPKDSDDGLPQVVLHVDNWKKFAKRFKKLAPVLRRRFLIE